MDRPNMKTEVTTGFRAAGFALLGLGWLGLVLGGIVVAFIPQSKYPPVVGWVLLAMAATILVTTAQTWVKAMPGLLGLATLNALIAGLTGHTANLSSAPIPRSDALTAAVLLATSTVLSLSFTSRKIYAVDRIAFLIYAICIFWGAVDHRVTLTLQMGIATFSLFSAWLYDRLRRAGGRVPRTIDSSPQT
jgi:hypothetical protein